MAKKTRELTQVYRVDGKGCFVEATLDCAALDKIVLNFVQYDPSKGAGSRMTGNVSIYLDVFDAQLLANDILSGRLAKVSKAAKKKAAEENKKYADPVYAMLRGTSGKDGKPIARLLEIVPGAKQPWILRAKSGPGEDHNGLVSLKSVETNISVPMSNEAFKKLAFALQTAGRVWEMYRFGPVISDIMKEARAQREAAINDAKAQAAAAATQK